MDMNRIDEILETGSTAIWEVHNSSGTPHNFHPPRQLPRHRLRRRPATAALSGWKDTVYAPPTETVRLVVRSPRYADPRAPYMFHCHILRHEVAK
jgi:FtsP/CotA-like multicopper oxidase with cupredoxin domain